MGKLKKFYVIVRMTIFVPTLMFSLLPASFGSVSAATTASLLPICANTSCARQKAILRKLERTRPSKKVTRKQIFNQIKAACDKMRSLDCPDIRNYKPLICFTDF